METTLIEKLDKARYNLVKWLTIGWAIWFGTYILKDIITTKTIIIVLVWIGLIGWTIFTINLINFMKLNRKVKKDSKPFVVSVQQILIKVKGTSFNVKTTELGALMSVYEMLFGDELLNINKKYTIKYVFEMLKIHI